MPLTFEELRNEVLALPADRRQELILSLSEASASEPFALHPDWRPELKRRMADFESGKTKGIPWEEVERELDALLETR